MWLARSGFSTAHTEAFSRHSDHSTSYFRYILQGILESELYTTRSHYIRIMFIRRMFIRRKCYIRKITMGLESLRKQTVDL